MNIADKALWMDMKSTETKVLLKEESIQKVQGGNVKAGIGTKKWSMLYMDGQAEIGIS